VFCGATVKGPDFRCRHCDVVFGSDPWPGTELVPERIVGRGGVGVVWRARERATGSVVAVKFLGSEDEAWRLRFEREARMLRALDDPGIVRLIGFSTVGPVPRLVLEFVDGKPLSELLPLPPRRALGIVIRVAEAVAAAHRIGIVHRDLKPENVLVGSAGEVKVADFGIARWSGPAAARDAKVTASGFILGTPRFLPPEALDGAPPDPRMDVFSLGFLLRETIDPGKASAAASDLPDPIRAIVSRAMAFDPVERWANAGEMLDPLWLAGQALVGRKEGKGLLAAFLDSIGGKLSGR
jgi:serine/threonine-protein kinase